MEGGHFMKQVLCLLFVSAFHTVNLAASEPTYEVSDYSIEQIIISSAVPTASSEASSITSTAEDLKMEAQIIQNAVQEYHVTGIMSSFLQSKINNLNKLNLDILAENEAIDLLLKLCEKILNTSLN